ncbi:hypothetical protein GCM10029978_115420 [Actinoallomurus acanthiterrae]
MHLISPIGRLLTGAFALAAIGAVTTAVNSVDAAAQAASVPPGVVQLHDGATCPPAMLCLYRDYGRQGPAYGIGAGFHINLRQLPMAAGVGGTTAANNVSSWVNNTRDLAVLIDLDRRTTRHLRPGQSLEEPPETNDTVDAVAWLVG